MTASQAPTGAPTVGDTIWVTRTVELPAGRIVRPADWRPEDPVELLAPARVTVRGGSADIAYPIVIWQTGEHTLEVPGPLVLAPEGAVDSLPPARITVEVGSVLPRGVAESTLSPQPRAGFVPLTDTSPVAPLLFLTLAVLLLLPLHWWWRRRGQPRPRPLAALSAPAPLPLERWADAGESRAVAAVATARLRAAIAAQLPGASPGLDTESLLEHVAAMRPDWPLAELGDVLRSLDEARFGDLSFPDAVGLARWADELEPRLTAEAA